MEVAGLAVGIVSLYSATVEILSRIDAYKSFGTESEATILQFEATYIRLQDWGERVGIHNDKVVEDHSPRLDDARRVLIIERILQCLKKVFDKVENLKSSIKPPTRQLSARADTWGVSLDESKGTHHHQQSIPKRSRIAWATGGREKLNKEVLIFKDLVDVLYNVANPSDSSTAHPIISSSSKQITEPISDSEIALKKIHESVLALDRREVLDWLDALKNDDEFDKHISSHVDGTCQWVLDHPAYIAWESTSDSDTGAKFLWIHGSAGFGKTVLSAWLIKHIKETLNLPVAYCFSSSHAQRSGKSDDIVRTWITHLAQDSIDVLDLCQTTRGKQNARRASVSDIWGLLRDVSTYLPACVLVLDGLDEFRKDARSRFLGDVKNAVASTRLRVIITSRNEVDIESEISTEATQSSRYLMLECKVSQAYVQGDVHIYAQSIVAQKLPRHGEPFREEISMQMTDNSGGMFLWIKLQNSQLRNSQNKKTIQRTVQGMPQGLERTYKRDWDSIQQLPEQDRNRAIEILRWLTFGYRPLSIEEIAEALIIVLDEASEAFCADDLPEAIDDEFSNNEIKGLCGSLVELRLEGQDPNPPTNTVHLVHTSVREYLITVLPLPALFASQLENDFRSTAHHVVLATYCLRFLNCHSTWGSTEDRDSRPFMHYAAVLWLEHFSHAQDNYAPLFGLLCDFFKTPNLCFGKWAGWVHTELWRGKDPVPWTPLINPSAMYHACAFKLLPLMDFLHDQENEDIDVVGGPFGTPLQVACAQGCEGAFDRLMQWGADVAVEGGELHTAVNAAAYYGHDKMVKALITRDNPLDMPRTWKAIKTAASQGHAGVVELLISHTAEIAVEDVSQRGLSACLSNSLLHAAASGHAAVVRLLLERGAEISAVDDFNDTALHLAVAYNHSDVVKFLLREGASVEWIGKIGPPILAAAHHGSLEIVLELIGKGANVNSSGKERETPLHHAACAGVTAMVSLLLKHGALIDAQDDLGCTALYLAILGSHTDIVTILIQHNADINLGTKEGKNTIHAAAFKGLVGVVSTLVQEGADKDAQDDTGKTSLYFAAQYGQISVIEMLLRLGAKFMPDNIGWTPMHTAAEQGFVDIISKLTQRGADVNAQNNFGVSPLHLAAAFDQKAVVEMLLQLDAKVMPDSEGRTPLTDAVEGGHLDITMQLLEAGADPNIRLQNGRTPLHAAVNVRLRKDEKGDEQRSKVIKLLLERGAVYSADKKGWTPLHDAASAGYVRVVTLFLDSGYDVDARTDDGSTPLHLAVEQDNEKDHSYGDQQILELVELFFERGATYSTDDEGWTPLHIAACSGYDRVVTLLLNRGHEMDAQTDRGWTPLLCAASRSKEDTAELLLRRGANANLLDLDGWSPLYSALWEDCRRLVRHLIERGCEINAATRYGDTPLRAAIEHADDELIRRFIGQGADLSAVDYFGMTCSKWLKRLRPHLAQDCDEGGSDPDLEVLKRNTSESAASIRKDKQFTHAGHGFAKGLQILGLEDEARMVYQARYMSSEFDQPGLRCRGCNVYQNRDQPFYICNVCRDTVLCQPCMSKHTEKPLLDHCRGHGFLEIVVSETKIGPDQTDALDEWLLGIVKQLEPTQTSEDSPEKE